VDIEVDLIWFSF
ncbi:hypothetical protein CapIbe_005590, partial [Capra ibex]